MSRVIAFSPFRLLADLLDLRLPKIIRRETKVDRVEKCIHVSATRRDVPYKRNFIAVKRLATRLCANVMRIAIYEKYFASL